jgi:hypothetical protein
VWQQLQTQLLPPPLGEEACYLVLVLVASACNHHRVATGCRMVPHTCAASKYMHGGAAGVVFCCRAVHNSRTGV